MNEHPGDTPPRDPAERGRRIGAGDLPGQPAPDPARTGDGDPQTETTANYDANADLLARQYLNPTILAPTRASFLRRVPANSFIVDIGAGPGRDVAEFRNAGHVVLGIEPSERFVGIANTTGHGPVITGDIRRIPLPSASADAAWIAGSLVHIPKADAPAALAEVRRVVREGATLGIVVKEGSGEYWRTDPSGHRSYVAPYERSELTALLAAAGFAVTSIRQLPDTQRGPRLEVFATAVPIPTTRELT